MKRISILVLAGLAGCQSPPEPTTLVRVRGCGGSTQGYVLVQPNGYVGSLDDLTAATRPSPVFEPFRREGEAVISP